MKNTIWRKQISITSEGILPSAITGTENPPFANSIVPPPKNLPDNCLRNLRSDTYCLYPPKLDRFLTEKLTGHKVTAGGIQAVKCILDYELNVAQSQRIRNALLALVAPEDLGEVEKAAGILKDISWKDVPLGSDKSRSTRYLNAIIKLSWRKTEEAPADITEILPGLSSTPQSKGSEEKNRRRIQFPLQYFYQIINNEEVIARVHGIFLLSHSMYASAPSTRLDDFCRATVSFAVLNQPVPYITTGYGELLKMLFYDAIRLECKTAVTRFLEGVYETSLEKTAENKYRQKPDLNLLNIYLTQRNWTHEPDRFGPPSDQWLVLMEGIASYSNDGKLDHLLMIYLDEEKLAYAKFPTPESCHTESFSGIQAVNAIRLKNMVLEEMMMIHNKTKDNPVMEIPSLPDSAPSKHASRFQKYYQNITVDVDLSYSPTVEKLEESLFSISKGIILAQLEYWSIVKSAQVMSKNNPIVISTSKKAKKIQQQVEAQFVQVLKTLNIDNKRQLAFLTGYEENSILSFLVSFRDTFYSDTPLTYDRLNRFADKCLEQSMAVAIQALGQNDLPHSLVQRWHHLITVLTSARQDGPLPYYYALMIARNLAHLLDDKTETLRLFNTLEIMTGYVYQDRFDQAWLAVNREIPEDWALFFLLTPPEELIKILNLSDYTGFLKSAAEWVKPGTEGPALFSGKTKEKIAAYLLTLIKASGALPEAPEFTASLENVSLPVTAEKLAGLSDSRFLNMVGAGYRLILRKLRPGQRVPLKTAAEKPTEIPKDSSSKEETAEEICQDIQGAQTNENRKDETEVRAGEIISRLALLLAERNLPDSAMVADSLLFIGNRIKQERKRSMLPDMLISCLNKISLPETGTPFSAGALTLLNHFPDLLPETKRLSLAQQDRMVHHLTGYLKSLSALNSACQQNIELLRQFIQTGIRRTDVIVFLKEFREALERELAVPRRVIAEETPAVFDQVLLRFISGVISFTELSPLISDPLVARLFLVIASPEKATTPDLTAALATAFQTPGILSGIFKLLDVEDRLILIEPEKQPDAIRIYCRGGRAKGKPYAEFTTSENKRYQVFEIAHSTATGQVRLFVGINETEPRILVAYLNEKLAHNAEDYAGIVKAAISNANKKAKELKIIKFKMCG